MSDNFKATALSVIKRSSESIISSVDESGYPNTKAMLAPREHDELRTFYFTTNTSSRRVGQYRANPKAAVYFYDSRSFIGVQLVGEMEVCTDQATKERIWLDGDTMYYPLGVTDPDYCVLKFTARKGRLYQNFHSDDFDVA
jgi:general stress protein 26